MENKTVDIAVSQRNEYQNELLEILKSNATPIALRKALNNYHEYDVAAVLQLLKPEEKEKLFKILDTQTLSDILEYIEDIGSCLEFVTTRKKIEILSVMETDTAAEYLRELPRSEQKMLIDLMDAETQKDIAMLVSFDEDEIGSIMTTNFIEITPDMSVKQAMKALVSQAADNDNISTIYVVDNEEVFYGAIDLKDLILAREHTPIESITMTSYPYVYAQEQIEDCMERLRSYSEDSIPVLDENQRLLGVITSQTMVELVGDEMSEDYAKLGGLTSEEDLREPVLMSVGKRLPWLVVLLGLGLLVSSVVGVFEGVVSQLTLVICFQSLILGMAGNVGTQSLAVTIRVLMDEELSTKDRFRLVGKETRIGAFNGLILGVISFVMVGFYIYLFKGYAFDFSMAVSGCIGIALFVSMVVSSFAGTLVPILFKKMKIDPAVASGPLITTLNDLVAVVTYYGLAWLILIQILNLSN